MSRVGRAPIPIPQGVEVRIADGTVHVSGPKGKLERTVHADIRVAVEDKQMLVSRQSEDKFHRALHGLTRALLANMVRGVTQGYQVELEIQGVGYRAQKQGANLTLQIGYSHPIEVKPPAGVTLEAPAPNRIVVGGIDKEQVGQTAATIRAFREAGSVQGQGHSLCGRAGAAQGGQGG